MSGRAVKGAGGAFVRSAGGVRGGGDPLIYSATRQYHEILLSEYTEDWAWYHGTTNTPRGGLGEIAGSTEIPHKKVYNDDGTLWGTLDSKLDAYNVRLLISNESMFHISANVCVTSASWAPGSTALAAMNFFYDWIPGSIDSYPLYGLNGYGTEVGIQYSPYSFNGDIFEGYFVDPPSFRALGSVSSLYLLGREGMWKIIDIPVSSLYVANNGGVYLVADRVVYPVGVKMYTDVNFDSFIGARWPSITYTKVLGGITGTSEFIRGNTVTSWTAQYYRDGLFVGSAAYDSCYQQRGAGEFVLFSL